MEWLASGRKTSVCKALGMMGLRGGLFEKIGGIWGFGGRLEEVERGFTTDDSMEFILSQ
jgi:hypothetical protein